MIALSLIVIVFSLCIYSFNKWQRKTFAYFADRNVKFEEPGIIKSILEGFLRRPTLPALMQKLYNAFPDEPYVQN